MISGKSDAPIYGKPRRAGADAARHVQARTPRRRQNDHWRGTLCWIAARGREFWDFIDKRQIDKHIVSVTILYGTVIVMQWAMGFAAENDHGVMTGVDMAAVIAAVTAPYMALQAVALKWYFDRQKT